MISAIFALALLAAGQPSIVTVTILFFTVRFCALAPTGFYRPPKRTLITNHLEFTGIELDIGTAGALALFSAEETVGKALAVEFEALRFFAIALQSFFEFGAPGFRSLYGYEGVVLEHVLEAVVAGELNGVELPQFNFASFPLAEQLTEHIFFLLALPANYGHISLWGNFEGHSCGIGRHP